MIGLTAENMIAEIKEIVLPRDSYKFGDTRRKGILFGLRYSIRSHEESDDELFTFGAEQEVAVLIVAPHSVFFMEVEDRIFDLTKIPLDKWENTSNHDSCWRSDGLRKLTETYFRLCNKVNEDRVAAGFEEVAPVTMNHNVWTRLCNPLWKPVEVELAKSDQDKKIVSLTYV